MSTLTPRQIAMGRRQLEIEDELIAQGMAPGEAARTAARRVISAGNGADLDNLEAAATPLSVEPMVGVDPESLPADEYGAVSGRTVREANRPLADAERALAQERRLAGEITAGYRSGQRNWRAEGDYQYAQEYGLGGFEHGEGKTDLDYRRELQDHQGYIRTQHGMVPVGRQATPEQIAAARDFDQWANETPGTERQAQYDPEGYEQFREGARNNIRNRAKWEEMTFGAGPDRAVSPLQEQNREARRASEARVRDAQRGRFYQDRLLVDQGVAMPALGPDSSLEELERAAFRDRYAKRQADLDARKQAVVRTRQAQTNPLEYMNRDDISDWNRFAAAQSVLGGRVRGATPNDVDQAREQALALQESRRGLGQGFQPLTPAQERRQTTQADAADAEAADVIYRAARGVVGTYADDKSWTNFLSRLTSGGTDFHDPTVFTADERRKAIAQLKARFPHLGDAELAGVIDAAASNTTYVE